MVPERRRTVNSAQCENEGSGVEYSTTFYHCGYPTPIEAELKFQMPYPCWLKLEKSPLFQAFLEGLEALQTEESL